MSGDERTISFPVWPHVISLEGAGVKIAAFLELVYNDARIPRTQWGLANRDGIGRRAMAAKLKADGKLVRRLGIATLTLEVCEAIALRARLSGLKAGVMHLPTEESRPKRPAFTVTHL